MKKGKTNKTSWFLLVFGWDYKVSDDGKSIAITEGRSMFVTDEIYAVCKVGMLITVKER